GYDVSGDLTATLQRAEREDALVVLGVPACALPEILDAVGQHAPSVGLTDVTSVKGEVQALVEVRGMADRFVGGHPLACTSRAGGRAALTWRVAGAGGVVAWGRAVAEPGPPRAWFAAFERAVRRAEATGAITSPGGSGADDRAVARLSDVPRGCAETFAVVG